MRIDSTRLGWACVVMAVLVLGALGGCGEQAPDMEPVMIDDIDDPGVAEPAEIPEDAETMADVLGSFTMPTSFRMTVEEDGMSQSMALKMDGDQAAKMRIEHESPQGVEVMIMDFEGGQMISYNADTKEGFSVPISEEEAADAPMPWEDYDESFRIVGSEEINGVDCWVVETTDEEDMRAWIGKADGLMRQVQDGDEIVTFVIDDLNAVPDSEFEVPSDVEISDMTMGGPMGDLE